MGGGSTIILELGCVLEAAQNVIRLTEPGYVIRELNTRVENAVRYITSPET
jgi:hypothetical protein